MSKLIEEWKDIEGYNGKYQISDWGRVKTTGELVIDKNGRKWKTQSKIMQPHIDENGYRVVNLKKGEYKTSERIHRLVAIAFIPNSDNKPCVDHIIPVSNGGTDKVDNLRWVTYSENNMNELTKINMINSRKGKKQICQYTLDGELVKIWDSFGEASRNGYSKNQIWKCCNKINETHKGFKWKYN